MGDKICEWFATELPGLTRWIGGMSEWEAVAFAVGLMAFSYLIYVAGWNLWQGIKYGETLIYIDDEEDFEPWMDEELWRR